MASFWDTIGGDVSRTGKKVGSSVSRAGTAAKRRRTAAAAAAAEAAAAGRTPTAPNPAGDPNAWMQALLNDPTYLADIGGFAADNAAAKAKRDAAVKALMFQFSDPSNPYATVSELARQEASQRANMTADRAARGVLASGGTKLQTQDIGHDYGKALYDATNAVTGQIGALDQSVADTEHANALAQAQALDKAAQSLIDAGYAPSVVQAAAAAASKSVPMKTMPGTGRTAGTGINRAAGPTLAERQAAAARVAPSAPRVPGTLAGLRDSFAPVMSGVNPTSFIPNPDRPGFSANGTPISSAMWGAHYNPFAPNYGGRKLGSKF